MKLWKCCILIVGVAVLLLSSISVSAEEVSDGTGDVYHWAINPSTGLPDYIESTDDKPYIDITRLSYTKNGQQVMLEMTLGEDIMHSPNILYHIWLETDEGSYMAFYGLGLGMYTGYNGYAGESGVLVNPVSGNTFTATFNITDPDATYTFWGQTIEIVEVGSDEAWHDFAGYYTGDDPAADGDENNPPVANANGPYQGVINVPVNFDSSASDDIDGTIVNWAWNFGDDTSSEQQNPQHTYTQLGNYTVTLAVTDNDGATNMDSTWVNVVENDTEPPSNITLLPVADEKDGKLRLTWTEATDNIDVAYYRIYCDKQPTINTSDDATTYLYTGLTNGVEYTFNVSAVDTSENEGNQSNLVTGTPTVSETGEDDDDDDNTNGGTAGFEALAVVAALGVAFIILRRRK